MLADAAAKLIRKDLKALKNVPEGMTFTVTTTGRRHVTVIIGGVDPLWRYEWVQYGRHSVGAWEETMDALYWKDTITMIIHEYREVVLETQDLKTYSYTIGVAYDHKITKPATQPERVA